jgi:hypothetical protein
VNARIGSGPEYEQNYQQQADCRGEISLAFHVPALTACGRCVRMHRQGKRKFHTTKIQELGRDRVDSPPIIRKKGVAVMPLGRCDGKKMPS